jgi:mRNA-degrading endonuclease RelE of RelBE toxin-antitoxin system
VSYKVKLRRPAQKDLDDLAGQDYEAVARVISSLEDNPRPVRVKKLAESELWRIRVRQCRIIYAIDDKSKEVIIVRIARRNKDTYKKL